MYDPRGLLKWFAQGRRNVPHSRRALTNVEMNAVKRAAALANGAEGWQPLHKMFNKPPLLALPARPAMINKIYNTLQEFHRYAKQARLFRLADQIAAKPYLNGSRYATLVKRFKRYGKPRGGTVLVKYAKFGSSNTRTVNVSRLHAVAVRMNQSVRMNHYNIAIQSSLATPGRVVMLLSPNTEFEYYTAASRIFSTPYPDNDCDWTILKANPNSDPRAVARDALEWGSAYNRFRWKYDSSGRSVSQYHIISSLYRNYETTIDIAPMLLPIFGTGFVTRRRANNIYHILSTGHDS